MNLKKLFFICLSCLLCCQSIFADSIEDQALESVSLLTFHMQQFLSELSSTNESESEDKIFLTPQERQERWDKTAKLIYLCHESDQQEHERLFSAAYIHYEDAIYELDQNCLDKALEHLHEVCEILLMLREQLLHVDVQEADSSLLGLLQLTSPLNELDANQAIPSHAKKLMRPYIIPANHPMRERLDALFKAARITVNEHVFHAAGFTTICQRPRTFVRVARHPLLEGHLIKVYMDTELRKKQHKESWEWFVKRCEGAKKVREIIQKRKIKHFVVADKYIYPLPQNPSPPSGHRYTRHLAILLVTDMNLAPDDVNYNMWFHKVTKEQLNELYDIIWG